MPRRMGRPGLVGTMARTAVVAGTASAVVGHSQQRQAQKMQAQAQAAPAATAPVQEEDWTAKLQQLSQLKDQGVLSEEEFASAKAKILDAMTAKSSANPRATRLDDLSHKIAGPNLPAERPLTRP